MTTCKAILLAVFVVALIAEVVGIYFASKDVFKMVEHSYGLWDAVQPKGWKAARGPIAIGTGAALGAIGNIASMYLT